MRTWDNGRVALWNVAATEERAGWPGAAQLQRFPRDVRRAMERGAGVAEEATGCEVRFVTGAPRVRVTVTSPDADGEAYALRGDYVHSTHRLPAGVTRSITLERPTQKAFGQAQFVGASPSWSPEVWRVRFGRSAVLLHAVEALDGAEVRPPKPGEETPRLRWLAYGSSITHAHGLHGYLFHAARHLGADVLNLGLSGSCLMEPAVADHVAARDDWDVATFEVGVNMRDAFTEEEFARRARHLVEAATRGDRLVFLLTQFPNSVTYNPESPIYARCRAYDDTLRALAAEFAGRGVGLIEGADVLTPLSGLSCDLVHPSEYGHADMGANLARLLRAAGVV